MPEKLYDILDPLERVREVESDLYQFIGCLDDLELLKRIRVLESEVESMRLAFGRQYWELRKQILKEVGIDPVTEKPKFKGGI